LLLKVPVRFDIRVQLTRRLFCDCEVVRGLISRTNRVALNGTLSKAA